MKKRNTQHAPSISHRYLPEEIITDILTRLPVKTLIRFKCVSKSWLVLISDPSFINTHLVNSSKLNNYTHQRLIIRHSLIGSETSSYLESYSLHSMCLSGTNNNNEIDAVELDYSWRGYNVLSSIVGSCNGLVCVVFREQTIFIWNPSTREYKQVPCWNESPPSNDDYEQVPGCENYSGFGYDHFNDDYKVVWIGTRSWLDIYKEKEVRIYSLRTNSWGRIENFPLGWPENFGKIFNGVLHWVVRKNRESPAFIISLDLGSETCGEIAQPNYGEIDLVCLAILDGCFTICCDLIDIRMDIWVMKEYGVRDSWIKMYTILYIFEPELTCFYPYPLCISMKGEVLLIHIDGFILYDPNCGTFRNPEVCGLIRSLDMLEVSTYVESLVSPNMYDRVQSPLN